MLVCCMFCSILKFIISVKNESGNGVDPVFDGSNLRNHGQEFATPDETNPYREYDSGQEDETDTVAGQPSSVQSSYPLSYQNT